MNKLNPYGVGRFYFTSSILVTACLVVVVPFGVGGCASGPDGSSDFAGTAGVATGGAGSGGDGGSSGAPHEGGQPTPNSGGEQAAGGTAGGAASQGGSASASSGSAGISGGGTGGTGALHCDEPKPIKTTASGLPLLETNPGAPVALYLDFDGGSYGGTQYVGYNSSGSQTTFEAGEGDEIRRAVAFVDRYYAMFDINVTTDDDVRRASKAWGWIVISEDYSGGRGSTSRSSIGTPAEPKAICGADSVRDSDRSRRIAHELGHNFGLFHSGVWERGVFHKWEDWHGWDRVYGPIMGGGGEGDRNGWSNGFYDGDNEADTQDDMEIIRARVEELGGRNSGWRVDDFPEGAPAALCQGSAGSLFRKGILGSPTDEDSFEFAWGGGSLTLEAIIPEVSAALLDVDILLDGTSVLRTSTPTKDATRATSVLATGNYQLRVKSRGGYGEIGAYEVRVGP